MRAAIAEGREFVRAYTAEVVPGEVGKQLGRMEQVLMGEVAAAAAKVAAHTVRSGGGDGEPALGDVIRKQVTAAQSGRLAPGVQRYTLACPHCEHPNNALAADDGADRPAQGDHSICSNCGLVSVFESGPLGMMVLRRPTPPEQDQIAGDPEVKAAMVRAAGGTGNGRQRPSE
ncbi:MAG: hypothetical protein ACRDZY_12410 [Acidimicrobiales bacterium]